MTDEMLTEAQIKLNFTTNISAAIDALVQWDDLTGATSDKIVKKLLDVDDAFKNVGVTASGGSEAVRQWTNEFGLLTAELDQFIARAKQVAQTSAVANPLNGLDKSAITNLSDQELAQFATTLQAKNFNPASAILQEYNARLKEAGTTAQGFASETDAVDAALQRQAASAKTAADEVNALGGKQKSASSTSASGFLGGADTSAAYSLMNTSFALGTTSAALLGIDGLAVKTSADFQQSFAQVERTVNGATQNAAALKQQLIALSTTVPVSFSTISNIAALGGQLGIGADQIVNFTKAAAEFSATTNLTADAAATALGRLGQLLEGGNANYENLASSILKVGANSVSTESQIVGIAQRIAGVGKSAGLTAADVIALSGTLASLGVQSYGAGGTVTRFLTDIQKAVSSGGASLQEFANISHLSAQQFVSEWASSPTDVMTKLFNGIQEQGANAVGALNSLGLKSVQDIQTLQKLSQNTDVWTKALHDANTGIADSTTLAQHYNIMTDTLSAKMQILKNTFEAVAASTGNSSTGFLTGAVEGATKLLTGIDSVMNSGFGQVLGGITIGITGLVGAVLAGAAPMALFAGNAILAKNALEAFGISEERVTAIMTAAKWATAAAGIASIGVAAATAGIAFLQWSGYFTTALDRANAFFGDASSLTTALEKDKTTYEQTGKAIDTYSQSAVIAAGSAKSWAEVVDSTSAAQKNLEASTNSATGAISAQTIAYGTNAKAAVASMLESNKQYQNLFSNKEFQNTLKAGGGSMQGLADAILGDPENGITKYKAKLIADIKKEFGGDGSSGAEAALTGFLNGLKPLDQINEALTGQFSAAATAMQAYKSVADATTGSNANLAQSQQAITSTQTSQVAALFDSSKAYTQLASDTEKLGEAFYTSGGAVAVNGAEMAKTIADIMAVSNTQGEAANRLQGFFDAIVKGGFASTAQLTLLKKAISDLGGSTGSTPFDMGGVTAGFDKMQVAAENAANSAQKAAKQVYTLAQYGSDLGSVMTRAFDIRTGPQTALDTISSGWDTIAKNAAAAADAEAKAQATLATLASDRAIDEYWLKVAQMYGDTTREAELQAKLATNTTDTATAQKSLSDAQDKASTSLTGNSDAAIANRKSLEGLVSNYQTYLTTLAASGVSQDQLKTKSEQLKQQFIDQATQLGYNRTDIDNVAKSFDDMTLAIERVPRNITVAANTDPALQALNEFMAKAQAIANQGIKIATPSFDPGALAAQLAAEQAAQQAAAAKAARLANLQSQLAVWVSQAQNGIPQGPAGQNIMNQIHAISAQIQSGNYWTGGYTGDGGKYDSAGTVHRGEFVFDQTSTRNIGPANLAFLQSMAQNGATGPASGAGHAGVVALDAGTIMAIAEAVAQIRVVIPGVAVAKAVSNNNVSSTRRGA